MEKDVCSYETMKFALTNAFERSLTIQRLSLEMLKNNVGV